MRELERILRDRLRLREVVVQGGVAGHLGSEHAADLVGDALTVTVDGLAGEILVLGHLAEDGGNFFRHAGRDLVDLFVLDFLRFLGCLRERIVGLDFVGDGLGELVDLLGVDLGEFLVGHQRIGLALGDRVLEQLVDGLDMAAGFFSRRFHLCVGLLTEGRDFGLLPGSEFSDSLLVEPEGDAENDDGSEEHCGKLFFKLLPHDRGVFECARSTPIAVACSNAMPSFLKNLV